MKKLLSNIVFTKNRPLQLHAYLKSFLTYFPSAKIQVYILYRQELFDTEYQHVFDEFPECRVIRESNFRDDFVRLMDELDTRYVNFGTDDVVYFDSVDLALVEKTYEMYENNIFGFSLRMNPQSISEKKIGSYEVNEQNIYSVNWKIATDKTARYPFELNGTIYRTKLVREIVSHVSQDRAALKKVFPKGSRRVAILSRIYSMKNILILLETFHNPNNLEGHCYRWIKTHKRKYPKLLFFQKLCGSAIQVNIVNTAVNNPIDGGDEYTVEHLNQKYIAGFRFDIEALKKNSPHGTHAGKACFRLKRY